MTLARELSLQTIDGEIRLIQEPVGDWSALGEPLTTFDLPETTITPGTTIIDGAAGTVQRIDISLTPGTAEEFGLVVRGEGAQGTRIGVRPAEGTLVVDRRESGQTDFHEAFASLDTAPIRLIDGHYQLTLFVDRCSVEVFAHGGQVTMTELIFPLPTSNDVSLYALGGSAAINSLHVTQYA
jgi:fructan beta-fructosidase